MLANALGLLSVAGLVLGQSQSTQYTATGTAAVDAARATAKTRSPTSNVKGKAFDRLAIIWLENTDYDLAIGDREHSRKV
jgi:acid phosphatase